MDNLSLNIRNSPHIIQVKITGHIVNTYAWCLKQTILELVKPLQILILDLRDMQDICVDGLKVLKMIKMKLQLQNSDFTILAHSECKLFELLDCSRPHELKIIKSAPQFLSN